MNIVIVQVAFEIWGAVFSIICSVITWLGRKSEPSRSNTLATGLLLNAILLICDSLAYIYRGSPTELSYIMVRITNLIVFLITPLMFVVIVRLLTIFLATKDIEPVKWVNYSIYTITAVDILLIVISQFSDFVYFFDENNMYHRGPGYSIVFALGFIMILIIIVGMIIHRKGFEKYEFVSIMAYLLMPVVASLIQFIHYGLSLNNITSTLALLLIFVLHEYKKSNRILKQERQIMEAEIVLAEQKAELVKKQNQIAVSQIKPHFMFNALSSISMLCRLDPERAAEAIERFATYLRINLNAMSGTAPVSFSEELSHIRTYVWLEQMRFGDDLDYTEEIETEMFQVPALAIQPIVENAIKYGLKGREGIVKVCLATRDVGDSINVIVTDNGIGFDPNIMPDDGRLHVGLANVRERIESISHGEVIIESEIGVGTTVTIKIPKL